ncbi:MAG: WGR domain-containing protein [Deltaproteobacteria bacterium]|nr:WGR domain-containing protein [Deltaproteobacteria bacterium]
MRRFEFVGGGSAKFWTARVEGSTFHIVFGKLGSDGQRKEKEFDDESDAEAEMEKKIAEKLKEGYVEVAADGATATEKVGKKGADAASPKLVMPPRLTEIDKADPALMKAASTSLKALARSTTGRSWRRAIAAKEARRALSRVRGIDLGSNKDLAEAFDAVVDAVTAKPSLPLSFVLSLCDELPASAFARALTRWGKKPAGPAGKAITTLAEIASTLGDDELALRAGLALCDSHVDDAAAVARFAKVRSFVEAGAAKSGGLKKWLTAMDNGDAVVARRTTLFAA